MSNGEDRESSQIDEACTLYVASIEEVKERVNELETVFCRSLYPALRNELANVRQCAWLEKNSHLEACKEWEQKHEAFMQEIEHLRTNNEVERARLQEVCRTIREAAELQRRELLTMHDAEVCKREDDRQNFTAEILKLQTEAEVIRLQLVESLERERRASQEAQKENKNLRKLYNELEKNYRAVLQECAGANAVSTSKGTKNAQQKSSPGNLEGGLWYNKKQKMGPTEKSLRQSHVDGLFLKARSNEDRAGKHTSNAAPEEVNLSQHKQGVSVPAVESDAANHATVVSLGTTAECTRQGQVWTEVCTSRTFAEQSVQAETRQKDLVVQGEPSEGQAQFTQGRNQGDNLQDRSEGERANLAYADTGHLVSIAQPVDELAEQPRENKTAKTEAEQVCQMAVHPEDILSRKDDNAATGRMVSKVQVVSDVAAAAKTESRSDMCQLQAPPEDFSGREDKLGWEASSGGDVPSRLGQQRSTKRQKEKPWRTTRSGRDNIEADEGDLHDDFLATPRELAMAAIAARDEPIVSAGNLVGLTKHHNGEMVEDSLLGSDDETPSGDASDGPPSPNHPQADHQPLDDKPSSVHHPEVDRKQSIEPQHCNNRNMSETEGDSLPAFGRNETVKNPDMLVSEDLGCKRPGGNIHGGPSVKPSPGKVPSGNNLDTVVVDLTGEDDVDKAPTRGNRSRGPKGDLKEGETTPRKTMANISNFMPIQRPPKVPVPAFKYIGPVRKKADREDLQGVECQACTKFYDAVQAQDADGIVNNRCEHHQAASRHRYRYAPPATPDGFWNIGFDTE